MGELVEFRNRYIRNATYVVRFETDLEMRSKQANFERAFGALFSQKESINANTPNAAHRDRPRFIYSMNDKQLVISQSHIQFSLTFDRYGIEEAKRIEIIKKNFEGIEKALTQFLEGRQIFETGLVVALHYPSDLTDAEMAASIYERFVKFPERGEVVSTDVKVGYKVDGNHFLSLGAAVYQQGEGVVEVGPGDAVPVFNTSDLKVSERGIVLTFDLNDKPRTTRSNQVAQRDAAEISRQVMHLVLVEANSILREK